ncbi:MAG: hypothetical protein ACKV2T_14155 [Kofleriaceae bacterium]
MAVRTTVMRQHHYNFAHKVLPLDVTTSPVLWKIISGDKAASYLEMRWSDAAPGAEAQPSKGLIWIEPVRAFGVEIRTIRMPPPDDVAETYYGAIAKSDDGAIRYFVCEKGSASVFWSEWRGNMRIRGEALEEVPSREVREMFTEMPSQSAPWEVSSASIPGMPYLASFLTAVFKEMADEGANAAAKKQLAAGADLPAPTTSRAPQANTSKGGAIIAAVLIGVVAIVALTQLL